MSAPEVITLGCRLNAAESEAIRLLAGGEEDLVIVNSCAVTNEAVRQTRQAIRRAKRDRPGARVVVTGCAAQVEPEAFAAMPEVDRVVGNREKLDFASFVGANPVRAEPVEAHFLAPQEEGREGLRQAQAERLPLTQAERIAREPSPAEVRVSDIFAVAENAPHLLPAFAERSRAFVEVQNGCDHRCTFCIIPYGRGNSRSVPAGLVVEQVKALSGQGYREIVLTGVDVTSYGPDLPGGPSLGLLVERIMRHVPDLPRLRLSSLDCIEIDPRLEEIVANEPRFMPHLHMSFQAGDDMVLKRMRRRHSRAEAVGTVARLKARRPELAIGADLIAGFPTETDEMHENSLRLIDECDIVMGHVFPYSPKKGTPAARMPLVPPEVVRERARRLREACARRRTAWLEGLVGTTQRVLMEKGGRGHTENFAPVVIRSSRAKSRDPIERSRDMENGLGFARQGVSTSLDTNGAGEVVNTLIVAVEAGALVGIPQ
ncbi:MAG TPA: tRNA (N(6)-L-threonylcarbamoyladenosine(37)-C(2))-methylthiotransferase MtaB [Allosphingosinicella sp.]|nr:tRNA (N(6)-L-threonylcarbamoyladenosine(37)-C(2))-methylthiotransferase MtaB [Allosphingosinicella sp.]